MNIGSATKDFIINELSSGIIVVKTDGKIGYYNDTARQIFPEIEDDGPEVLEKVCSFVETAEPVSSGDRLYHIEERILAEGFENDSKIYVLTDATGHYRHIREIEEQKKIADNANKAKSYFLASMSHEIRTPINTILGMDEMILRESNESTIRDYAADIHTSGRILLSLINDILDISKIEAGKMEILPVDYSLSGIIYDLSNMIRFKSEDKGLKLRVTVSEDIPSRLFGDDVRIRQILMNLLTNAVKYTEKGTVDLKVSLKEDSEGEEADTVTLLFEVEDTGIGIRTDDRVKLFSNYRRIEDDRHRKIEGTGLGLPITIRLLKLMGSELQLRSEYGRGSCFYFELKQKVVDSTPVGNYEKNIDKLMAGRFFSAGSFTAPDAEILLVDDNSMNRRVFVLLLKQTRVRVTEAGSGKKALKLASKKHFDIIFMDHMMPGMDGVETMKRIKADENSPCRDVPIVMLTANAVAGAKEGYLKDGFDGVLSKPVSPEKLENLIKELLPEEKVMPSEASHSSEHTAGGTYFPDTDDLPVIFGLDWNLALIRYKKMGLLNELLREFEVTIGLQADKLQELKEGLPDTFEDYRAMVHGMKSSAGSVGIITLSGMAMILEKAAADRDAETIDSLHNVYIREWRSYKERLKDYLYGDDTPGDSGETIDPAVLKTLLKLLSDAMEEMDVDEADEVIKRLSSFTLPEELSSRFDDLKAAVTMLDQEMVEEILNGVNIVKSP